MTYTPTPWANLSLPAIDAANLDNIENFLVAVAAGGRTGVQAGALASEHAGLPIGVQLPLNATLIWTDSNMGAGSNLNADLLDGQHASYFMPLIGTSGTVTLSGTTNIPAGATLSVAGTFTVTGSGTISGLSSLGVTGTITANAFNVSSMRSIKENITPLTIDALGIINAIPVYNYSLKADPRHDYHIGFMVEDTPAGIVNPDASGIDLYAALAVAYKAIQELSVELRELKEKVIDGGQF